MMNNLQDSCGSPLLSLLFLQSIVVLISIHSQVTDQDPVIQKHIFYYKEMVRNVTIIALG